MDQQPQMDSTNRDQLIRKRGMARGMLTRMQTFLESGNRHQPFAGKTEQTTNYL
jgi:hypothetical protein